jgi:hypothetical protein
MQIQDLLKEELSDMAGKKLKAEEGMKTTELDFSNFANATRETYEAILDKDFVPSCPRTYKILKSKLQLCQENFPKVYQKMFIDPLLTYMDNTGEATVNWQISRDGEDSDFALLARPILQRCSDLDQVATDAFQEVVSDLYDGFLSEEDREEVKHPDFIVVAPLVSWQSSWEYSDGQIAPNGPCTYTSDLLMNYFGIEMGIVNLPVQLGRNGLLTWAALGHETTGHDILRADAGLIEELNGAVKDALLKENIDPFLAEYWSYCFEETASDVMGILNMGPAVAVATIGFFRALNAVIYKNRQFKLDNVGISEDVHPADILRGYLAASVVRLLEFDGADKWADYIEAETNKDLTTIRLDANPRDPNSGKVIASDEAKKSAKIVAKTIVEGKMKNLEDHSLGEIQNWKDNDESIVNEIRSHFGTLDPISDIYAKGIYAAHVVAAAVIEAVSGKAEIDRIFTDMLGILKLMHEDNPVWNQTNTYLEHPGDLAFQGRRLLSSRLFDKGW